MLKQVKTTYPKTITEAIIHYQAIGFSAHETQKALKEENGLDISLNAIYRHRKSIVAQEIIDEDIRNQKRRILKAEASNPELALKYANELLKIEIPARMEIISKNLTVNKTEVTINGVNLLSKYNELIREENTVKANNLSRDNPAKSLPET